MKKTLIYCAGLVICSTLLTGCATTSDPVIVSEPNKLTSMGIDTQDFALKANEMVDSLLESGTLDRSSHHPAVIAVGRVVNNTSLYIDADLLTKKIRVRLNQSGKAVTDTTRGALNELDFMFSGKIIDTYVTVGNKHQHTYTFQLSLTDPQGLALWEEEKEVTKGVKQPSFGL